MLYSPELSWQKEARCVERYDIFFREFCTHKTPVRGANDCSDCNKLNRRHEEEAKKICAGCPVKQECLEYALANREQYGVWGGMTFAERRREFAERLYQEQRNLGGRKIMDPERFPCGHSRKTDATKDGSRCRPCQNRSNRMAPAHRAKYTGYCKAHGNAVPCLECSQEAGRRGARSRWGPGAA